MRAYTFTNGLIGAARIRTSRTAQASGLVVRITRASVVPARAARWSSAAARPRRFAAFFQGPCRPGAHAPTRPHRRSPVPHLAPYAAAVASVVNRARAGDADHRFEPSWPMRCRACSASVVALLTILGVFIAGYVAREG